jgi:Fur family peroxide stress response transcriptional regulator
MQQGGGNRVGVAAMSGRTRRSRQRERLLELLEGTDTHPTAEWLHRRLKKEFPSLSMGTVYRNLGILVRQGKAARLELGNSSDRFEANTSSHCHFVCERCGSVADLALELDESLPRRVERETGLEVRSHRAQFYGLCARCAAHRGD